MTKPYAAVLLSAIAAASGLSHNHAFSDATSSSPSDDPQSPPPPPKFRNNNPRTTSAGFDPEPLEEGARIVTNVATKPHGKNVSSLFPPRFLIHALLLHFVYCFNLSRFLFLGF